MVAPRPFPPPVTMPDAPSAPPTLRLHLPDAEATARAGAALAAALRPGDAVLLSGEIGAGKSALARALIATLLAEDGRAEEIPSPSFTLVQVYDTLRGEVWHVDLHRLAGPEGAEELGLGDAFGEAVCLVEWPDRLGALAPSRRLELALDFAGADEAAGRWLEARAVGGDWDAALAALEDGA